MNKYTIYCTSEQTDKAIKLGAPITLFSDNGYIPQETADNWHLCLLGNNAYIIPTAEEMIGWLEEQGLNINIAYNPFDEVKIIVTECSGYKEIANIQWNESRKGAILAAIDAALEYLIKTKRYVDSKK